MARIPKLLIIHAAGNEAASAEFASGIIKRESKDFPVISVSPREVDELSQSHKAPKGLLLRESAMVCVTKTARPDLDPDLFLLVKEKGADVEGPFSDDPALRADADVAHVDKKFSPGAEEFSFAFDHWTFQREATAIIMAGGDSRRMGQDKALLEIEGETMISRIVRQLEPSFKKLLISAANQNAFNFPGINVVPDEAPGAGPLMALVSALTKSETDVNFIMPCDIPDPPQHLIARLLRESKDADIVVPMTEAGELEPLFAVYRKSVLPSAREALSQGARRVISFYPKHKVKRLALDRESVLLNLNTMDDYLARVKR